MLALLTLFMFPLLQAQYCTSTTTGNWFTLPSITTIAHFTDYGNYLQCATGYLFIDGVLLAFFVIMIVAMGYFNIIARIAVAGMTMTLISSAALIIGWTDLYMPIFFAIITAVCGAIFYFQSIG